MKRTLGLLAVLALLLGTGGCASRAGGETEASAAAPVTVALPAGLADADFGPWLEGERQRVATERRAAQQQFEAAELACWRRFAVNDCVRKARVERRATVDRLRQQELLLNDLERQRRTAERLRRLEQKQAPDAPR